MTNPGQRLTNDRLNTAEIGKLTTSGKDWKNATLGRGRKNDHLGQRLKNYDPRQRLEK
jgi:hypothetical protein